ncbi:MAG: ATP-dependent DNA ligase [Fimbriimonadaceae bacterium]
MREFARLFESIDATTGTNAKREAVAAYLKSAPPADAAWAVFLLSGRRRPSPVKRRDLRAWACAEAGISDWLFEECYSAVADLAETIARVLPEPDWPSGAPGSSPGTPSLGPVSPPPETGDPTLFPSLADCVETYVLGLAGRPPEEQRETLVRAWQTFGGTERFLLVKLLTGGFRVGVSQELVLKAVHRAFGVPVATLSRRLMGDWQPSAEAWVRLIAPGDEADDPTAPYPFALAHPIGDLAENPDSHLGPVGGWIVEYKWDGIRCQVVRRAGQVALWSRGEESIGEAFPEILDLARSWPDGTVVDGEILAWRDGRPMPFADLQRRINRKSPGRKLLAEVPCRLMAFDLLEEEGVDIRPLPTAERRRRLARLLDARRDDRASLSEIVSARDWADMAERRRSAADRSAEGLMLKRAEAPYPLGRRRGEWWKWKLDPHTVDAVLVYAQRGSGKRASQYTDYTFAVWRGDELVPFAKAYSGLDNAEIDEVDAFVRRHTRERFGPVRTVEPKLVFELAFEGIQASKRHKSGVAVRFPRIVRWRRDKGPEDADRLETLWAMAGMAP